MANPSGVSPSSTLGANSLAGFLAVFAQESLEQFIATMPKINLFTKNFDSSITNGGISVTTRISTTNWGVANDLTTGYAGTSASASAITAFLKLRDFDTEFDELQWATVTPQVLLNTFFKPMGHQMANAIVVDAINNITSSLYTNTITVATSSNFTVTGSTSLQTGSTALDNLEIPFTGRYAIVMPSIYQSLVAGILPTYIYGNAGAVQDNVVQNLLGFDLFRYPRFVGSLAPQGGNIVGTHSNYTVDVVTGDKLVGILGNQDGLVCAVRSPVDVNNGLVQSATAVDPSSGLSLQTRIINDISKPSWRLAVVSIFGTAAGNTKAVIPIITQST